MKQKKSSLGKNTLFNLIKNISAIAFPLITFPYISRVLGVENVGKINFGNSKKKWVFDIKLEIVQRMVRIGFNLQLLK